MDISTSSLIILFRIPIHYNYTKRKTILSNTIKMFIAVWWIKYCTGYHTYCSGYNTDGNPYSRIVEITKSIALGTIYMVTNTILYVINIGKNLDIKLLTYFSLRALEKLFFFAWSKIL